MALINLPGTGLMLPFIPPFEGPAVGSIFNSKQINASGEKVAFLF